MPKKISREKAKEKKLIKFFTDIPCRNGHISERYVNDGKCIVCVQERGKKYGKIWYQKNKERLRPIRQKWQENNRKKAVEYQIAYRKRNPESYQKTIEKGKKNFQKYRKEYQKKNKKLLNEKKYERLKTDYIFRLKELVRARIQSGLRQLVKGKKKSMKTIMYLGCSYEEYKGYLEKKFKKGMNWSNMGGKTGWQIDHIKPLVSFDLSKQSEQLKAFNFKNTQPMWAKDNRIKGPRYNE